MLWNKKDDKKSLPDLPPLKTDFALRVSSYEQPEEKQSLPSFPDVPTRKGFSQAAIKEAVAPTEEPEEELPSLPEWKEEEEEIMPRVRELKPLPPQRTFEMPQRKTKNEDVYVKIDRFHSARKSLTEAKAKLAEMEELLKKIRETRMREEQELSSWEKEVDSVKFKVEDITKNIFEKVE